MTAPGGPVAVDHMDSQLFAHGQWAGRCSTSLRPVVAIRAGMFMIRVRTVAHRAVVMDAATAVARAR